MQRSNLFGISFTVTNYEELTTDIFNRINSSGSPRGAVAALAVHGLMEAYNDQAFRAQVNSFDWVVPDGQPVRWALNYFHSLQIRKRVYGPALMLHLLQRAAETGVSVFLYGSKAATLTLLEQNLKKKFPSLLIAGVQEDRFRESTEEEKKLDRETIIRSGAKIVFVGRGCPRQEKWVADNREHIPAVLVAVGAAFDFHAGTVKQAPRWMQDNGMEWLFRLLQEPRRLWRRYVVTNSQFILVFLSHLLRIK
ncbi:MAG TPA: glycosyltransferase [Chitinophagaceae bacterium]|nr:WecB/TagA/CpsF family glycosyltransferase [Bacteroidota bacterium]HBB58191.1 glycosyltransferase [Chitinophagaceae bacterium]